MQEWYKNNQARKKYQFPYLKIVEVPYNLSYGLFPLPDSDSDSDSDTDSCTMQILWERDLNLNLSQWKHVLHNTM